MKEYEAELEAGQDCDFPLSWFVFVNNGGQSLTQSHAASFLRITGLLLWMWVLDQIPANKSLMGFQPQMQTADGSPHPSVSGKILTLSLITGQIPSYCVNYS